MQWNVGGDCTHIAMGLSAALFSATVEKRVGGRSVFVLCGEEKNTDTLFSKSVFVGYLT